MSSVTSNITLLNRVKDSNQYALIPGREKQRMIRRLKSLNRSKGGCYFTTGISKDMIDFIYRAVTKLGLKEKKILFSRGAVKLNNLTALNAVGISELDWDVGISIRIPHRLNYNRMIHLVIGGREHGLRLMEVIVLSALLHIAYPGKPGAWCADMSASIISRGWKSLHSRLPVINKKR
ncbi:MAG: hypothetical protein MUC95_10185 [Spirochaetes bacterium]|nr:hypothetical protein [Spirochaetota bacterium]